MSSEPTLRYGVPPPIEFEAFSSWLSRLALAQGCTVAETKQFFGFTPLICRDVDASLNQKMLQVLRQKCGLPLRSFAYTARVMDALAPEQLYLSGGGWPKFRYCAICLRQQEIAHLDIRWRFAQGMQCLMHGCLLEERCPQCKAWIRIADMAVSPAGRAGYATQRRCQQCCYDLALTSPRSVHQQKPVVLTSVDVRLLRGGNLVRTGVTRAVRRSAWAKRYDTLFKKRVKR